MCGHPRLDPSLSPGPAAARVGAGGFPARVYTIEVGRAASHWAPQRRQRRITRAWSGQPRRANRWTPLYAERGLPLKRKPLGHRKGSECVSSLLPLSLSQLSVSRRLPGRSTLLGLGVNHRATFRDASETPCWTVLSGPLRVNLTPFIESYRLIDWQHGRLLCPANNGSLLRLSIAHTTSLIQLLQSLGRPSLPGRDA